MLLKELNHLKEVTIEELQGVDKKIQIITSACQGGYKLTAFDFN